MSHASLPRQRGRFTLLAALIYTAGAIGLVLTGYWMGQQSHLELAGVDQAPPPQPAEEPANAGRLWPVGDDRPQPRSALHGRWQVVDATRETPLRDIEFFDDNRVELRDGEGSRFGGKYSTGNGRLTINAPDEQGGNVLFEGSYSVAGNRLTITHDDVVVTLVSGPEADEAATPFQYDQRRPNLEDIEKIAVRTDDRQGCRDQLGEALRDEDFEVVGEGIADAILVVEIDRQPLFTPEAPYAGDEGWRYFYAGSLLGRDDVTLFEYESEVEEETGEEACEELAEILAEEIYDVVD